jgi:hypothetical protein
MARTRAYFVCRHCGLWKRIKRRGLCRCCYYSTGVGECYDSPRAPRLEGRGQRVLPAPTTALPRTEEKVRVLEDRAAARNPRQHLHHP